jgi:hypothetical protein
MDQKVKIQVNLDPPDLAEEMKLELSICEFLRREHGFGAPLLLTSEPIEDTEWRQS